MPHQRSIKRSIAFVTVCMLILIQLSGSMATTTGYAETACAVASFNFHARLNVFSPRATAIEDFNGDAKADLAVAAEFTDEVLIHLGDGAGGFAEATEFDAGDAPQSIAVGDMNNDGKADVVTANGESRTQGDASVMLGNGAGGLGQPIPLYVSSPGVSANNNSLALADFNTDGKLDAAVVNITFGSVTIAFGNGTGVEWKCFALSRRRSGQFRRAREFPRRDESDFDFRRRLQRRRAG